MNATKDRPTVLVQYDKTHTGFYIEPTDWGGYAWSEVFHDSDRKLRLEAFEKGRLVVDGQALDAKAAKRMRARITGTYDAMPPIFDPTTEPMTRCLIPGLLNHGRIPALSGPKGVGKTTFVCQLCAALIIRGRRFLDHFDPAEMTEEERTRDIWLINSETAPSAVHEELVRAGLEYGYRDGVPCYHDPADPDWERHGVLIVEHLQRTGGAIGFDLTDEAKRRYWEERFVGFTSRRLPPLMVISDGVTAMLGSDTSGYGAWTSGFRMLLQEAGIPNGLGVLHSPMSAVGNGRAPTPMNGVESMGEWDGIWYFAAASFPVFPWTSREFYTAPRMGDDVVLSHKMSMDDDGMMRLLPRDVKRATPDHGGQSSGIESGEDEYYEQAVLKALREAGKAGMGGTELTGRSREGEMRRKARDRLVEKELIFSLSVGRASRWFLAEFR